MNLHSNIRFDHQDNIPVFPVYRGVYFKKNKNRYSTSTDNSNLYYKKVQQEEQYFRQIQSVKNRLDSLLRQKGNYTVIKRKEDVKLNIPEIVLKQSEDRKKKLIPKSLPAIKVKKIVGLSQQIPLKDINLKKGNNFQPYNYNKKFFKQNPAQHRYTQQICRYSQMECKPAKYNKRFLTQDSHLYNNNNNPQKNQYQEKQLRIKLKNERSFMTTKQYLIQKLNHIFKIEDLFTCQKQQSSTDRSVTLPANTNISHSLNVNHEIKILSRQIGNQRQVTLNKSPILITPIKPVSRINTEQNGQNQNQSLQYNKNMKSIKSFKSLKFDKTKKYSNQEKQKANIQKQTQFGGWRNNPLQQKESTLYM